MLPTFEVPVLRRATFAVGVLLIATACSKDGARPPVPASVVQIGIVSSPVSVGTVLPNAAIIEVRDSDNEAMGNIAFSAAVTAGGGTLISTPAQTNPGPTSIGQWNLGTVSGTQSVSVTVGDLPPLVVSVNTLPLAPATITVTDGDGQLVPAEEAVPSVIRVRVADTHGNGIPSTTVTWTVSAGEGLLAAGSSVTDADGVATAPTWTLGDASSGAQRVTATVGALSVQVNATLLQTIPFVSFETSPPITAVVGTTLGVAPTFVVRNPDGSILPDAVVTVEVTEGEGVLTGAPLVSGAAPIGIGSWTLGTTSGEQTVTVSGTGIVGASTSLTAVADAPDVMTLLQGDAQETLAGAVPALPIRVEIEDQYGNVVVGQNVQWEVLEGGGTLAAATSVTNALGVSTAPAWTIGRTVVPQQIRAVAGATQAAVTAVVQTDFDLEVRFNGDLPSQEVQDAFANAVNRIRAAIVGQMTTLDLDAFDASGCVSGLSLTELVTGVIIYATIEDIDGAGGVLGSAGPCFIRASNQLTFLGRMRFDTADLDNMVNNGSIESVILHEMMHVIGVGTLWDLKGLMQGDAPTSTPLFTGALAREACLDDHGGSMVCAAAVPIEDCLNLNVSCGGGTINSHWKESVFASELMTGFLNAGLNPFSKMTIQSLADMGYGVNTIGGDQYTVPAVAPGLMSLTPAWSVRMGEPHGPLASFDHFGRLVKTYEAPPLDH